MKKTYLKIEAPKSAVATSKDGLIKNFLKKIIVIVLKMIVPKANPDFDEKIDEVNFWLIEFEEISGIPKREIGLDEFENPILKMPYKSNYGYWTDNNLLLKNFKSTFKFTEISEKTFSDNWESFDII